MGGIEPRTVTTLAPGYPVGVVAARLGVPTATLRSWSQRYGLGPNGHLRGKHRLYSESDIAVLTQLLDMVRSGISPASAADSLRHKLRSQTLASDGAGAAELAAMAHDLDTWSMSSLLARWLDQRGVIATWNDVIRPAFALLLENPAEKPCIDAEHALSWAVSGTLRRVIQGNSTSPQARLVLACTPGEHHLLPLEALAATLAEASIAVSMLGSDVPAAALHDAVDRIRPAALVLWSQSPATADIAAIQTGLQFSCRTYAAGPGWPERLPDSVERLNSIRGAYDALATSTSPLQNRL